MDTIHPSAVYPHKNAAIATGNEASRRGETSGGRVRGNSRVITLQTTLPISARMRVRIEAFASSRDAQKRKTTIEFGLTMTRLETENGGRISQIQIVQRNRKTFHIEALMARTRRSQRRHSTRTIALQQTVMLQGIITLLNA
jgi:hypothetical protein